MKNHHEEISINEVKNAAKFVVSKLPDFWRDFRTPQIPRVSEEISWIFKKNGTVVDLGGGCGFHSSICAYLGMKAICVDNFKIRAKGHTDDKYYEHDLEAEIISKNFGVEFIHTDLLEWEPPFEKDTIDVIMSFDNIEHLHHSPRRLYKKNIEPLKKGGLFLLGAPNFCALPKRFNVLLGKNISEPFNNWYMHQKHIGHVREPVISDLVQITKDLELDVMNIFGRNWLGLTRLDHSSWVTKTIAIGFDKFLRTYPYFCSDIYVLAKK